MTPMTPLEIMVDARLSRLNTRLENIAISLAAIADELAVRVSEEKGDKAKDPLDVPLPCDIWVDTVVFRKGVSLGTLVDAARHWHLAAVAGYPRSNPPAASAVLKPPRGETIEDREDQMGDPNWVPESPP